jgi:general secretion pathway protein D
MGFCSRSAGLTVGAVAVTMGLGIIAATPSVSYAQDNTVGQKIVPTINITNADLNSVVTMLKQQFSIDIVTEPGTAPYGLVNVSLTDKPIETVLKYVAMSAGAALRFEDGIYTIGPKDAKPARKVETEPVKDLTPAPKVRGKWEHIRMQNVRPSELLSYLGIDQGRLNKLQTQMIYANLYDAIDGYKGLNTAGKMPTMIPYPNNPNGQQVPPVVPTGDQGANSGNRNEEGQRGGFGGGGQGGGLGGFGGGGQGGGLGGGLGGQGRGGQGGGLGGGQGAQGALLPEGIESVLAYDVDNTLIVRYSDPEGLRELKEIVRLLDIAPKQLMIRAEFVEVRQDDLRSFGIDWQIARGSLSASTFPGQYAQGDVVVNYATGSLISQLRASLVEGKGRLVNAPMATTTNNVPVSLLIGTQVPIITNSVAFGQGGQGITVPSITTIGVGSGISVLPRINGDGSISMVVNPQISDIISEVANPAGGTIPIISTQTVTVVRRIGNNETMVIGGLIKKNDRTSVKKVPIFADIPLIGQLFRSTSATVADSELLIFVTPSILPDPVSTNVPGVTTSQQVRP